MVIVIVDDDWGMLELVTFFLKKSGHTTFPFPDSRECWGWFTDSTHDCPDLLISDLMMPYFDGAELIQRVRTQTPCRNIPIILMSSVENVKPRDNLWDLFLPKSFNRQQLLDAVEKVMEKGA